MGSVVTALPYGTTAAPGYGPDNVSRPAVRLAPHAHAAVDAEDGADARTVVVVGHEPTISVLAHILHDTDDDLASQISFGVPTATAVIIDVPGAWADLEPKSARIREIFTARKRD